MTMLAFPERSPAEIIEVAGGHAAAGWPEYRIGTYRFLSI
jgi:hypothetical protein